MIESIADIEVGKSYACKFKVKTLLDEMGRPAPNLSDVPLKGEGWYEGFGHDTVPPWCAPWSRGAC